jgi:hypothetical protein
MVRLRESRLDEAVASCERALAFAPSRFPYLVCLGLCRLAQSQPEAAEAQFRRAIAADTGQAIGWANLAAALDAQGRDAETMDALQRAESLESGSPDDPECFVDIGARLFAQGRNQEALDLFERNLAARPSARGHGKYALALLTAGRLIEGWHQYEFRWLSEALLPYRSDSGRPPWAGQDLSGKTVLLRIEQGFGDAIQFLRYAPFLKALGATTLLVDFSDLAPGFDGVDRVFSGSGPAPEYDYYVNLMSLPRVFGSSPDAIPARVPYLHVSPERPARWRQRLAGIDALRVGLVWAGNPSHLRDRERSVALGVLRPLSGIEGVRYVSLQVGPAAAELSAETGFQSLPDLGREVSGFADTAAIIANLDLVVCVDTAVAHLAGALGKPVWLLLPQQADWRWMEDRDDTPWYPTMRLFRQRARGDWAGVVERVAAELRELKHRLAGPSTGAADSPAAAMPVPRIRPGPPEGHRRGFSAVTEARAGILQYLPDEAEVGDCIGWYGEYLQGQVALLVARIHPGSVMIEAGAGIGAHSLLLAAALGPAGHLVLYEPRPQQRRLLRQNLAANRVANCTLMRGALGSAADDDAAATDTLDDLQLERLDWLKVSRAARAAAVLDGGAATLWRLRPRMLLDAPDHSSLVALAARARDFGYRCWRIATPLFGARNYNRRGDDLFGGRVALALLAIPEESAGDVALDGGVEIC